MCSRVGGCGPCCCGNTAIKIYLWMSCGLYMISGISFAVVGALKLQDLNRYAQLFDGEFYTTPTVFLSLGVVIFIASIYGIFAAFAESRIVLYAFSFVVVLVSVVQIGLGVYSLSINVQYTTLTLMRSFFYQEYSPTDLESATFDYWHYKHYCCGVEGPRDFTTIYVNGDVPNSCCYYVNSGERCNLNSSGLHLDGCSNRIGDQVYNAFMVIGLMCLGELWTAVFPLIFAFVLASRRMKISHIGSDSSYPDGLTPVSGFK